MKYLDFAGRRFELVNADTVAGQTIVNRCLSPVRYSNIFEAYGRPSQTKVEIWDDWKEWFNNIRNIEQSHKTYSVFIFIYSRCTSNFTIVFNAVKGERNIFGYITKDHNKAVII